MLPRSKCDFSMCTLLAHCTSSTAVNPKPYRSLEPFGGDLQRRGDGAIGNEWRHAHHGCFLQAGYYCSVCECVLRDSQSYLDHINGKYHNRALGMNMVVERSTADQVT